ncbi:MAG: translocation/assembly module TamB [Candidatus Omnitrophica bacterium]|nr:translocation/assembly module TamB [Candidatus Omnitrophota bacterium]MBU4477794.1 translocation/assembly module TamB [Candidatus Omnitrophota bacterium]MCG2704095.1 translocation/assembly module TamB [Candidatus Omnitrophota bacterium]
MIRRAGKKYFTPLEKAPDEVGGGYQGDDGSSKPPSSITVRGRSSLTGFIWLVVFSVTLFVISLFWFLFTEQGAKFTARLVFSRYCSIDAVSIAHAEGNFLDVLTLRGIVIRNVRELPAGSIISIRELKLAVRHGFEVRVDKACIMFPGNNAVIINGKYEQGVFDFVVRAPRLDAVTMAGILPRKDFFSGITGRISDAVIIVKGTPEKLSLNGIFSVFDMARGRVSVKDSHCMLDLSVADIFAIPAVSGELVCNDVLIWLDGSGMNKVNIQYARLLIGKDDYLNPELEINNGKLFFPGSDTLFFYGNYREGMVTASFYSGYVDIKAIGSLFPDNRILKKTKGALRNIDITAKGPVQALEINGNFITEKISINAFSGRDIPVSFALSLKNMFQDLNLNGTVMFKGGTVSGNRIAKIKITKGRILFSGNWRNPELDFKGNSLVERTKIKVSVRGTAEKPELKLTSEPSLPEGNLMIMLVTGKSWKRSQESIGMGKIDPDIALDFIDYFLFGGAGAKIAEYLGISDIVLRVDKTTKKMGVSKDISDKVAVTYGIEQSKTAEERTQLRQEVKGVYKVTDTFSVEGEKELESEKQQNNFKTNENLWLKYKKEF